MTHPLDNCLREIEWLRAEWSKESKTHIARIEALEAALREDASQDIINNQIIGKQADRIEALEAALREIADLRYSNMSAATIARAALAPEQATPPDVQAEAEKR